MSETSTSVTLHDCAKTFPDGTKALQPVNLDISAGETVVLLGPSGCGKTTLLRIIAGLEIPDAKGRVLFNEQDVTTLPIEKRNVGMVFQSYALFPNMTVRQNIAYGLKIRRTSRRDMDARVTEMLDMMQISELADRRIDQLSGGQRQRVALARAIAPRPQILLLDEPLTALDALLRERLRVEIDDLLRNLGTTAIYVTHDQSEAMALGDRIVVMDHGKIAQIGAPREIYYSPANNFVADFIGTINRILIKPDEVNPFTNEQNMLLNNEKDSPCEGVVVMFRPEDVEIVDAENSHFSGRIQSAFFLGNKTRLVLNGIKGAQGLPVVVESTSHIAHEINSIAHIRVKLEGLITISNTP